MFELVPVPVETPRGVFYFSFELLCSWSRDAIKPVLLALFSSWGLSAEVLPILLNSTWVIWFHLEKHLTKVVPQKKTSAITSFSLPTKTKNALRGFMGLTGSTDETVARFDLLEHLIYILRISRSKRWTGNLSVMFLLTDICGRKSHR